MQYNPPFNRPQRIALAALGLLILLAFLFWRAAPYFFAKDTTLADLNAQKEWENYAAENLRVDSNRLAAQERTALAASHTSEYNSNEVALNSIPYTPTYFDPNTSSIEAMIGSGMPISAAKSIIKYRNKGGRYYKTEDLKRMYNLSEDAYNKVAPYVQISPNDDRQYRNTKHENKNNYTKYERVPEPTALNINTATEEQWRMLRGIGPGYSKRIVALRHSLGGFIATSQVSEVYGLPDSTWEHIKDRLVVTAGSIKKINANTATEEELAAHPYIRAALARNIVRLRNDLKQFNKVEDLRQVPLINEEKYRKIAPYISVD